MDADKDSKNNPKDAPVARYFAASGGSYPDEISLFDLMRIFLKHQKVFWLGVVLVLVAGFAWLMMKPKYVNITQQVILPYSLNAVGQPNNLLVDQQTGALYSGRQDLLPAFWQFFNSLKQYGHAKGFKVSLVMPDGAPYRNQRMPFIPNSYSVSARVPAKLAMHKKQEMHQSMQEWVTLVNKQMLQQKQVLATTVAAEQKDLATLTREQNYGSHFSLVNGSVSWADLAQTVRERQVRLDTWHGFELGHITVARVAPRTKLHVVFIVFLATFFGALCVLLLHMRELWREEVRKV